MTPIPVVWWTLDPDSIARGYWDQGVLEDLFAGALFPIPGRPSFVHLNDVDPRDVPPGMGAIVVLPGRFHADKVDEVNLALAHLPWVLLIVTSDEERLFPLRQLRHRNLALWVQTPRHGDPGFGFGVGYPPGCHMFAQECDLEPKPAPWFLSAQMTHPRRREAGAVLQRLDDTEGGQRRFYATPGFTQGMDQRTYWAELANAAAAPAPSGPSTVDSFRFWEALELGAVPLADGATPDGPSDYWARMRWPWRPVEDWRDAPQLIEQTLRWFPRANQTALAWWTWEKRTMAHQLAADLWDLGVDLHRDVDDLVTVLMPTSQIPSHPSLELIEETIGTVRVHLPRAEILILADGPPPGEESAQVYADYLWRLTLAAHQRWRGVAVKAYPEHLHQTGMTRDALALVDTPLVLFVEHDTPLTPDRSIDWDGCARAILGGDINVIRFHHEALVLDVHQHLMPDKVPDSRYGGVPLLRCAQWSQRPHLASTAYYRLMASDYWPARPSMIEDVMHSVLECAWFDDGIEGWKAHRLAMYAPEGDIKRSYHLDGRKGHR